MKTKKELLQNLLVMSLNEAVKQGHIDLNGQSPTNSNDKEQGYFITEIAGKPTVINWFDIGYDELRVSIWWDYFHDLHPGKIKSCLIPRYLSHQKHN
ncbi:hypothetical protein [Xenorhabdus kozodoii]|uniref:Uncharacterized protein n=1 Tax=Xenorhabdus kozodoii TaxID=351676 RepID=A0A2D0KX14_9GAMM|nr:hypothetical protein [Xenorhabdus kozodoii]PHM67963.1 hypothetical protein Xkoz_03780 [Xenorhabdus kozodoii]